jgi:hypothetical protein
MYFELDLISRPFDVNCGNPGTMQLFLVFDEFPDLLIFQ